MARPSGPRYTTPGPWIRTTRNVVCCSPSPTQTKHLRSGASSLGLGRQSVPPVWRGDAYLVMLLPSLLGHELSRCLWCVLGGNGLGASAKDTPPAGFGTRAQSRGTRMAQQRLHNRPPNKCGAARAPLACPPTHLSHLANRTLLPGVAWCAAPRRPSPAACPCRAGSREVPGRPSSS